MPLATPPLVPLIDSSCNGPIRYDRAEGEHSLIKFMKKLFRPLFLLLLTVCAFTACEENMETEEEFVNWQEKNVKAFQDKMAIARKAIAEAQATYKGDEGGDEEWKKHCDWRIFRTYAQHPNTAGKAEDSICVFINKVGNGAGCPLYTDSVAIHYLGRLIPSPSYPDGFVFDHSSKGSPVEDVFNPEFNTPARFLVSNNIEGFTTALQEMHIGDHWTVYIPSELGYGKIANQVIPGYSMLTFEVELEAYAHAGFPLD